MTDHTGTAKRLLVHYFRLLADGAGVRLDGDCLSEIEAIVEHIIAAAREPTTTGDDRAVVFKFTGDQVTRLLEQTLDLYDEYQTTHGHDKQSASIAAINETLTGLDAERNLWAAGEVTKPSQVLP